MTTKANSATLPHADQIAVRSLFEGEFQALRERLDALSEARRDAIELIILLLCLDDLRSEAPKSKPQTQH